MYVVDIHAHFYTKGYLDILRNHGSRIDISVEDTADGAMLTLPGGRHQGPLGAIYTDIDARLELMDAQNVDLQAMSLTTPMCHFSDDGLNRELAQAYNDGAAEFTRAHPDRFAGLMTLPMLNTADAVAEAERAAGLPGMRGVYMGTNVARRNLSDPDFAPIFAKVAELDLPIFLHPTSVLGADRLDDFHTINTIGNPVDTTVAATFLIFSGLLDRHPNLTVNLPHAGGALPYLISRIDHGWTVRAECKHMENAPSSYLTRFTYDTISHASAQLEFLASLVGVERILLGSDFCFDMGYERPLDFVITQDWLDEADKAAIAGLNACRILGLDAPAD